ncbi:MAG: DUF3078 domain-containing protein [Bacteroidales bacterium]|jgi:hypothetical protein|nr:DUF3078 domain-containing protein [Bacteroidales bacterium]
MKIGLSLLVVNCCFLSSIWAQEVVTAPSDSLGSLDSAADSVIAADTIPSEVLSDDLLLIDDIVELDSIGSDTVAEPQQPEVVLPVYPALRQAWLRLCPMQEPSVQAIRIAQADSSNVSEIRRQVDEMPGDPSLSYAQLDLRLPLMLDEEVPSFERTTLSQQAQQQAEAQEALSGASAVNPFSRQLAYGGLQMGAVFNYAIRNLASVKDVRKRDSDLPIERKLIERQLLSGDEQVDTGLGLELETASLNMEQVVFHADKWHRKGTTDLQISQTALSDNWYKGGDNNMTISTYDKLAFSRYDESKKTTLDITLELRLSGYYTKADTVHPMRVNDNQFRADVSYGYKAWKNWYYSTSAYIKTPVLEYYAANSTVVKNSFFAPMEFNMAVGMDLKLTKNKNITYSLMIAPLSYNLKYVGDDRVSETSYGITEGKRSLNQVGASVTSKLEWKISESVNWSSRAYFFTSYHNVVFEYENTFNFTIGRYSTAKIYLYPRFDDSADDKLQMKEMFAFGLAFVW